MLLAGLCLWLALPGLDDAIYHLVRLLPDSRFVRLAAGLTVLGGGASLIPVGLAVVGRLAIIGRMRAAIWLFATIASGRIALELLKILIDRPRPLLIDRLVLVDSASFPSSHSAGAMLTGVALVIALGGRSRWLAVAIGFALLVGLSRVLLGVHWPSDVIAGWGFGLLWAGSAALLASRDE